MNKPTSIPTQGAPAVALSQLLDATALALQAVRAGQSGTVALETTAAALRPGVQALLFQVLRHLGRAQALRRQLAPRNPPPRVDALLCTALALAWDPQAAPYAPFTLVNQAVEAAKRHPATRAQASFVNACLRRFLRERDTLVAATQGDEVAVWNHPAWWIQRLRRDHPDQWQQILQANNAPAPMVLRISKSKSTPALYQQALEAINIEAMTVGPEGLALARPVPVQQLPGFAEGVVSVQDAAAQMARRCCSTGWTPRSRCAYWMPAPPPAARPPICWNGPPHCGPLGGSPRWRWMRHAPSASMTTCIAWD